MVAGVQTPDEAALAPVVPSDVPSRPSSASMTAVADTEVAASE